MQTICTLLQTDNYISNSSLNFYTPDALPDTQQQLFLTPNNSVEALKAIGCCVRERVWFLASVWALVELSDCYLHADNSVNKDSFLLF